MLALVLILVTYVLGSIPTGYWLAKAKGIDITKLGSGSTGATNVWRCVGKKEGVLVMVLDVLKGYLLCRNPNRQRATSSRVDLFWHATPDTSGSGNSCHRRS